MKKQKKTLKKCIKCGHEWETKIKRPFKCPKCQSQSWDKENKLLKKSFTLEDENISKSELKELIKNIMDKM